MPVLRELYEQALDLAPAERDSWIQTNCPDPSLRARLQSLLHAAEGEAAGLFDRPAAERLAAFEPAAGSGARWIGQKVGAFRLTELIGQGGMAAVFLAIREDADFDQQVAIKLLQRGLFSEFEQQLFRRERQALASLSHPHIARLIDGGIADNGVPYLAMEYVDGDPITRYCADQCIDITARLKLFVMVCRAVDAAHRALIVHRDIKPSNILVTTDGSVKLLDFGIAKLLLSDDQTPTRTGLAALTPEYAAPEQFDGGNITTATDVYALGVLLHELMLGERPQHDSAQRPSQRAAHLPAGVTLPALPHSLRRLLKGDLDNIILKALEREPQRRYASAGAMAEDIERHLLGQPVTAHPPSAWYRTGKFIRRHRGGVVVTALLVLGVLTSLGLALWQASIARQEAARANTVRDFMVDLLRRTTPATAQSERPDVPTLVYTAASALPNELIDQPETRIELLYTLGNVLRHMRDLERSYKLLQEAQALAANLPANAALRVASQVEMARTLLKMGDFDGAAAQLRPLLQIPERQLPPGIPRGMLLKIAMAVDANAGRTQQAVATGKEMLESYRADCADGVRCAELAFAESDFASVLISTGAYWEALALHESALKRKREAGNTSFDSMKDTLISGVVVSLLLGHFDAAESKAREADALVGALGNSIVRPALEGQTQIAEVLLAKENGTEAEVLIQQILDAERSNGSPQCDLAVLPVL